MTKLHLGCGKRYLPGWVHIDLADFPHIDYRQDVADLSNFETGSVDEIYASDLLEHIPRHKVPGALAEWSRVLRVGSLHNPPNQPTNQPTNGGIIHLSVPDFEACVEYYLQTRDLAVLESFFVGGQKTEYDFHYYEYDFALLTKLLEDSGFEDVKRYDWKEFLPEGFDDFSRSYLPHMDFEHGRLMNLNVVARKSNRISQLDSNIMLGLTERGLV
jgi:predicted SAM-dependent methyltransferase